MDEERTHTARHDERAAAEPHEGGEHSAGRRFIAGFATVGLGLAAVVAVWSWQATDSDHSATKGSTEANQEAASISTGQPTDLPESSKTTHPDHRDHANLPSEVTPRGSDSKSSGSKRDSGIAALGQDPYLPPNAWDGSHSGGFAPPTETMQLNPVNPIDGRDSHGAGPMDAAPQPNGEKHLAAPAAPGTAQGQSNNGAQNIPDIPGVPSELVPTNVPLPLPKQPSQSNTDGTQDGGPTTGAPQSPGPSESGAPGGNQTPGPTNQLGDTENTPTQPTNPATAKPSPPRRPGPIPIPDWGSAIRNAITDTTGN